MMNRRALNLLGSMPFGIILLIGLILACTFSRLCGGIYFYLALGLLGINLILTSVNNLPAAWRNILHKKLTVTPAFSMAQNFKEKIELPILGREQLVERAAGAARTIGFTTHITPEETQTTIFAERGAWNRLGVYAVQFGLLMIFAAVYWNCRNGYLGWMWIEPGTRSNKMLQGRPDFENANAPLQAGQEEKPLPFMVEGLDIQQKLLDQNRPVEIGNILDWITRVRFLDNATGQGTEAVIHMNNPVDYHAHRFLQVAFDRRRNAHLLQIQYSPGTKLIYAGGAFLCLALIGGFCFSHQRLWIVVEDGRISLGGDANRDEIGFEYRAKKLVRLIREPWTAEEPAS